MSLQYILIRPPSTVYAAYSVLQVWIPYKLVVFRVLCLQFYTISVRWCLPCCIFLLVVYVLASVTSVVAQWN